MRGQGIRNGRVHFVIAASLLGGVARAQLSPPQAGGGAGVAASAHAASLGFAVPSAEGAERFDPGSSEIARERLDADAEGSLRFAEVPGGIVLGRVAVPPAGFEAVRIAGSEPGGLVLLAADGREVRLPDADASLVATALAFASHESPAEWLIDVQGDSVHLAPELKDTRAGIAALRADLAPHFFLSLARGSKSSIVDDEVRLALDRSGETLRFEVDLELRYYEPARWLGSAGLAVRTGTAAFEHLDTDADGLPVLRGPEGREYARIAAHLRELARLAGWIGFFRWGLETELPGLEELRSSIASWSPDPVPTPSRVGADERVSWIVHGTASPEGRVPAWMQRHRELAERERRAERRARAR